MPKGTSIEKTSEKIKEVERVVSNISRNEMVSYTTRVGHHHTDVYRSEMSNLKKHWALVTVY